MKIVSVYDLEKIKKRAEAKLQLREESNRKTDERSCG